jgi:capsular polysaccharide biosynthesis protein
MRAWRTTPWLLIATLTAAGAAAAAGYGLTAPKHYRATAQLLAAPVPASDSTFDGLDVLRDVSGKPRAAETAAELVRSPQVVDAVRTQLGVHRSTSSLQGEVHAHVAGASNVVDVTVEDTSATTAAQLANAFVDALIAQRTTSFQSELAGAIHRDQQLLTADPSSKQAPELARRLAVLRGFQGQADPTVRRASSASTPTSASWPVLWSLILIGAGTGLALGTAAAVAVAIGRRGAGLGVGQYARPVPDRVANALVDRLEQRLAARESALAVRERELQARIDELRALEARDDVAQVRALQAKEAELEQREAALLNVRDDSSQAAALRAREAELDERERTLEERVAALTERELAAARAHAAAAAETHGAGDLAEREAALVERERALEARIKAVQERELAVARLAQQPAAARDNSSQAPAEPAAIGGAYNLSVLERLVAERGREFPDRLHEWESTVFFLRDYAESNGALPDSFDWLVQDTFAPLLA